MYIVSASTLLAIVDVPGDRTIPTTWRYAPILVIERTVAACQDGIADRRPFILWVGEGTDDRKARMEAYAVPLTDANWLLCLKPGTPIELVPSVEALLPEELPVGWRGVPSGVPSNERFWFAWCHEVAEILMEATPDIPPMAGQRAYDRVRARQVPHLVRAEARKERENAPN